MSARSAESSKALVVPCQLTERWLRFAEREQFEVLDEDLITIDVMTLDDERAAYKLCELVVSRGDLLRAIAAYGDPAFRTRPVRKADAPPELPSKARRRKRAD